MKIETSIVFKKFLLAAVIIFISVQGVILYEMKKNTEIYFSDYTDIAEQTESS